MKLAVGYPWSSDFVFTDFLGSALDMIHPQGYEVRYFRGSGQRPSRKYNDICEKALEWRADLICFINCDQVYPPDILVKLTKQIEKSHDVISVQKGILMFHRDHLLALERPWSCDILDPITQQITSDAVAQFVLKLQTEAEVKIWKEGENA